MTFKYKLLIHRINHGLNQPKTVIMVLVLLFAYFAYGNEQANKRNTQLLSNGNTAIEQLNQLLCKGVKPKDCNLTQAVIDLKNDNHTDNHNQTILLCKLFLTGRNQLDPVDQAEVEHICNDDIQQFTTSAGGSLSASGQTRGSSGPTASPSSSTDSSSNNRPGSTPPPANNPQQPSLLQLTVPQPTKCTVLGLVEPC